MFLNYLDQKNVKRLFLRGGVCRSLTAFSQLLTCRQKVIPSKRITSKKLLWMVRSVLNRTGKIIKKFSDFYFSSYHRKLGWFFRKNDTKMVITRKIKIVEFWNLVLLSIQLIADILKEKNLKKKQKIFFLDFEENSWCTHAFSKSKKKYFF